MKTFPHINFNTMNTLYTKCKQIIEDLDNMIPEDTEVSDWYEVETEESPDALYDPLSSCTQILDHYGFKEVGKSLDLRDISVKGLKQGVVSYVKFGIFCILEEEYEQVQTFIDKNSCEVFMKADAFVSDFKQLPEYSYHKTIYNSCERILQTLQSESCVNTLNLELAAALQFIEELEESDWKVGLKTYDKELVEAELEDLKQKSIDDAKEECKNNYETQISEFKANLEVLEKTPKKPEEESDEEFLERHRKEHPSIWESFKNMFK